MHRGNAVCPVKLVKVEIKKTLDTCGPAYGGSGRGTKESAQGLNERFPARPKGDFPYKTGARSKSQSSGSSSTGGEDNTKNRLPLTKSPISKGGGGNGLSISEGIYFLRSWTSYKKKELRREGMIGHVPGVRRHLSNKPGEEPVNSSPPPRLDSSR